MLLPLVVLSAALLAYQVALVHLLSITHWSHFAALVISLALMGFGASGSVLAIARPLLRGRERATFCAAALLTALSFDPVYRLSTTIPFDAFELLAVPRQFVFLSLTYLVLSIPFFLGATAIALAFLAEPERVSQVYSANLLGSGAGALLGVALLAWMPAERLPLVLGGLAGASLVAFGLRWIAVPAVLLVIGLVVSPPAIPVSMYKEESVALRLPEAKILAERDGPQGRLRLIASPALRYLPGASLALETPVPPRPVLYLNGQPLGARAVPADTSLIALTTTAAGFALPWDEGGERSVLVIGLGGGGEVLYARGNGARHLAVVDPDERLDALLAAPVRAAITERAVRNPRSHLRATDARFDHVIVTEIGSLAGVSSGMAAAGEGYLFTVEGMRDLWLALDDDGVLSITRWVLEPPRDVLRLLATARTVLDERGLHAADHVALVRGWGTATLLLSKSPLSREQVDALRAWSERRWFDIAWAPGVGASQANRFNLLDPDYFRSGAEALLGPSPERFLQTYPFRVAPVTDDAPFFFHFLPVRELSRLWRREGRLGLPYFEWGLIAQVLTLAQAIPVAAVLILLPLFFLRQSGASADAATSASASAVPLFFYFALLGLAFMLLEVSSIQRLILFLGHPIYATTAVLASFLIWAGIGSALAPRVATRFGVMAPFLGILLFAPLAHWAQLWLLEHAAGVGLPARTAMATAALAPLALCMGMPFPLGLQRVASRRLRWLPWCWAVNGYLSVIAAAAAPLLALALGFRGVLLTAVLLYLLARWALARF